MKTIDRMECLSCGWRGEARELKDLTVKSQASPRTNTKNLPEMWQHCCGKDQSTKAE